MESLEKWQKWKICKRSQDWWNFQAGKWSWKGAFRPQESSNMVQECDARGRWHQPYLPILTSQVNLDSSKIVAYREANTNGNLATESMNLRKKYQLKNTGNIRFFLKIEGWMSIQIWKKSRSNPVIYVTIKTSKEELHNLKLSLNQPTFNNYTKTLETYCQQEKSFIKSEINDMIDKKLSYRISFWKGEKKLTKWKLK